MPLTLTLPLTIAIHMPAAQGQRVQGQWLGLLG